MVVITLCNSKANSSKLNEKHSLKKRQQNKNTIRVGQNAEMEVEKEAKVEDKNRDTVHVSQGDNNMNKNCEMQVHQKCEEEIATLKEKIIQELRAEKAKLAMKVKEAKIHRGGKYSERNLYILWF